MAYEDQDGFDARDGEHLERAAVNQNATPEYDSADRGLAAANDDAAGMPQPPTKIEAPPSRGAKGPLIALVVLVLLLVVGFVAYDALTSARAAGNQERVASSTGSAASSSNADASTSSAAVDAIMLSDYDVTVYTETGEPFTLTQLADGKPFVMNFWATWCPYCVEEMPLFKELCTEYEGRINFAIIDCSDGKRETVEQGAAWLADNGYDMPAYYDKDMKAQLTFGAEVLPTTVVVSAQGEILTVSPGMIDGTLMRSALDSLL